MIEWARSVTWDEWAGVAALLTIALCGGLMKRQLDKELEEAQHGKQEEDEDGRE